MLVEPMIIATAVMITVQMTCRRRYKFHFSIWIELQVQRR